MDAQVFLQWIRDIFGGLVTIGNYLTEPFITLGDIKISILSLLTVGGLSAFLVVAIVKWVAN